MSHNFMEQCSTPGMLPILDLCAHPMKPFKSSDRSHCIRKGCCTTYACICMYLYIVCNWCRKQTGTNEGPCMPLVSTIPCMLHDQRMANCFPGCMRIAVLSISIVYTSCDPPAIAIWGVTLYNRMISSRALISSSASTGCL